MSEPSADCDFSVSTSRPRARESASFRSESCMLQDVSRLSSESSSDGTKVLSLTSPSVTLSAA
jgi:hypothetical protein